LRIFLPTKGDDTRKEPIKAMQVDDRDDNGKQFDFGVQVAESNQIEKRMPK
jgi:hypothetical protein